jgi:hypothetical protein
MAHIIVVGNEKGGLGQIDHLHACGHRAGAGWGTGSGRLDLDLRQRTFGAMSKTAGPIWRSKPGLTCPAPTTAICRWLPIRPLARRENDSDASDPSALEAMMMAKRISSSSIAPAATPA